MSTIARAFLLLSLPVVLLAGDDAKTAREYQDLLEFDEQTVAAVEEWRLQNQTESDALRRDQREKAVRDKLFALRSAYASFLERHPQHGGAMKAFASFLYEEDEPEAAVRLWNRLAQLDPRDATPHNSLGNHYALTGDWQRAVAEYEIAAQLAPREPVYRFNRASLLDLFRREWSQSRGCSEEEVTRQVADEMRAAHNLAPQEFVYAKAYAQALELVKPADGHAVLSAWEACAKLAASAEQKDFANAAAARVSIEQGEMARAEKFIAAISLPSSAPMKRELQRRLSIAVAP